VPATWGGPISAPRVHWWARIANTLAKELRFIIYSFPILNIAAAHGAAYLYVQYHEKHIHLYRWKQKGSLWRLLCRLVVIGGVVGLCITSSGFLYVSHWNYPGTLSASSALIGTSLSITRHGRSNLCRGRRLS